MNSPRLLSVVPFRLVTLIKKDHLEPGRALPGIFKYSLYEKDFGFRGIIGLSTRVCRPVGSTKYVLSEVTPIESFMFKPNCI